MGCLKLPHQKTDFRLNVVYRKTAQNSYKKVFPDPTRFYSYGFQGQERDDEIKGKGNSLNYEYRMHDPRLGRFFARDPLAASYPFWSPYVFSGNIVISHVELEGLEPARAEEKNWAYSNPIDALYIRANKNTAIEVTNNLVIENTTFKNHGMNNPGGVRDGQGDAFRHTFWNALNASDINRQEAADFATLHELGETSGAIDPNSSDYDPIAVQMDLHNNYVGRQIASDNPKASEDELKSLVLEKVKGGGLLTIKMDSEGNYLDKEGQITTDVTKKVLVTSNGKEFKGSLLGQKGYKPNLTSKEKPQTKDYNGDDGEY